MENVALVSLAICVGAIIFTAIMERIPTGKEFTERDSKFIGYISAMIAVISFTVFLMVFVVTVFFPFSPSN